MTSELEKTVKALGLEQYRRHIFLCADQTEPHCAPKEKGIESWDYLKRRLKELNLAGPAPLVYRPDQGWTYEPVGGGGTQWQRARAKEQLEVAQALFDHDLVDQLNLMVFPVVLGTGNRLWGETSEKKKLRLVDSKVVGDGLAILVYEPVPGDSA